MTSTPAYTVVATFVGIVEAEICRGMLRAHDINANILDGELVAMNWGYSQAIGGVKVVVPTAQANLAKAYIAATQDGDIRVCVCPRCGGTDVVAVPMKLHQYLWSLIIARGSYRNAARLRCNTCRTWL